MIPSTLFRPTRLLILGTALAALAVLLVWALPTASPKADAAAGTPCIGSGCDTVVVAGGGQFSLVANVVEGGALTSFAYGPTTAQPLMGDWDCDGVDTPGVYTNGYIELRNSNSAGPPETTYHFGDVGDIALVGDFNGDGCDSVSVYRHSVGKVFLSDSHASIEPRATYYYGNPGDRPFVGDFNGDGVDSIGLHRVATGLVYFRNTNSQGFADSQFMFGDPGDVMIAGDWDNNGTDTVAVYRPSTGYLYLKLSNSAGPADTTVAIGPATTVLPASGFSQVSPSAIRGPRATTCTGVAIAVGENWQTKVNAHPANTTFCIDAGVHYSQSVVPKDGDRFVGALGAVMDGKGQGTSAFSGSTLNVTIHNLEIRNYSPGAQNGGIDGEPGGHLSPDGVARPHRDGGWHVANVWVHDIAGGGVVLQGNDATIENSRIGHNTQIGFKFTFGDDQRIENTEVYQNNYNGQYEWGWEAGGSKNWSTNRLTITRVISWGNKGPGIWSDWNNDDTVYSNNVVYGNTGPGIFHEISGPATIIGNHIYDGIGTCIGIWCRAGTGILVANSGYVVVESNVIQNVRSGISFLDQNRAGFINTTSGRVAGNVLTNAGQSGSGMDHPCCAALSSVTWSGNTYTNSTGP